MVLGNQPTGASEELQPSSCRTELLPFGSRGSAWRQKSKAPDFSGAKVTMRDCNLHCMEAPFPGT